MSLEQWSAVDGYIADLFVEPDATLDAALRESAAAGLPAIHVSAAQGKLLYLLARAMGARRVLEIGTLGGYSAIWLGRAVAANGRGRRANSADTSGARATSLVITLEAELRHAELARKNLARAGLAEVVEVRVGRALETLPKIAAEPGGPFDLIFVDADKTSYPEYLAWSLRLSRPGSVIIADNVVRKGAVTDAGSTDPSVQAVRRFNELLAAERRVEATVIQTVGGKGYDGFAVGVVVESRYG